MTQMDLGDYRHTRMTAMRHFDNFADISVLRIHGTYHDLGIHCQSQSRPRRISWFKFYWIEKLLTRVKDPRVGTLDPKRSLCQGIGNLIL